MYVYQYTDWNAVKNIIKTNKLWATDCHHLNDSSEIYYGIELIIDAIAKEKLLSQIEVYQLKGEVLNFMDKLDIYISSLCLIEDDLSMWRLYGNCAVVMDKSITTLGITTEGSFRQNSILSCHYPKSFEDLDIGKDFYTLSALFDEFYYSDKKRMVY